MTDNFKIEFAPGCFDHFEGSQEELDSLIAEIKSMFENKTKEEIQAMSRPLDLEDLDEYDQEMLDRIAEKEKQAKGRTLQ